MTELVQRQASDLHWLRRIWHFMGVAFMFFLYFFLDKQDAISVALIVSGTLIGLDLLRLIFPFLNQILVHLFKPFLRTHEVNRVTAASFMLVGVTLIIIIFPKEVVLLSLLLFSVADPLAALTGIRFGKDRIIGKKTLQGSLAAFFACTLIAIGYYTYFHFFPERLLLAGLLTGLIGALSELVPFFSLDDNLTFPVLSSSLIYGLFFLFGAL